MANRQQRRAAAKHKKRQGENYADVLHKQKLIKEAVEKSAHDHAVSLEADIKSQRLMWMSVIALNKAFGFGGKRCMDYFTALDEVATDVEDMVKNHGGLYARTKLMEAASKITGIEITPIHEEEMMKARIENEANGIFFPPDDPDRW